ncbi:hypothetical protein FB45DRAFT_870325 [Roridomyces roridus]|uniref:Uncharacterized protein n=1 Tax=Roridomyces roridus TaxID=1738132 RepID=A0AAD7FG23_9AGAR|nr:hypothetical protein FB45DRAFT_870325 [Roridomyces roridus]
MGRESPGVSIFDWGTLITKEKAGVSKSAPITVPLHLHSRQATLFKLCMQRHAETSHLTIPSHPGVICTLGIEQNGARRRHVMRGHEFQPFTLSHNSVNLLSLGIPECVVTFICQGINPEAHAVPHNPMYYVIDFHVLSTVKQPWESIGPCLKAIGRELSSEQRKYCK